MTKKELVRNFKLFRQHCINLRIHFNTFSVLYSCENFELLNKVAPVFFKDLNEMMTIEWYRQCNALLDPSISRVGKDVVRNLSVEQIDEELKELELFDAKLKIASKTLLKYKKCVKLPRNKLVGHFDLECTRRGRALGKHKEELMHEFLENMQRYCDMVGEKIGLGPLDFSCSSCKGDVFDFLSALRKSSSKCG